MIFHCFVFQVAATSLESSLIKYSAKEYFFRASLCHLCVDAVNAQHAIQRYEEQFPAFGDSRECKLVKVGRLPAYFSNFDQITDKVVNVWIQNVFVYSILHAVG